MPQLDSPDEGGPGFAEASNAFVFWSLMINPSVLKISWRTLRYGLRLNVRYSRNVFRIRFVDVEPQTAVSCILTAASTLPSTSFPCGTIISTASLEIDTREVIRRGRL